MNGRLAVGSLMILASFLSVPARAAEVKLTPDELSRLLKVLDANGTEIVVPAPISTALGLSEKQDAPRIKQVTFAEDNGIKHGFAPLNDGSGYFFFRRDQTGHVTAFHVRNDFHIVHASSNFMGGERFMEIPAGPARKDLEDELKHWSAVLSPPAAAKSGAAPANSSAANPSSPAKAASPAKTPSPAKAPDPAHP